MKIFFSIFFFLLFPLQLFASVVPTTTQYLANAGNDPWIVMARAAVGAETGSPSVARENVFALAKTILAFIATASGGAPHDAVASAAEGSDLVAEFLQQYAHDRQIGNPVFLNDDFWGVLALSAAGVSANHSALLDAKATIIRAQDMRGGWSWSALPDTPDTDDTAAAIMALLELGMSATDPVLIHAFSYLSAAQNTDGGFPNVPPGVSSIDSTAWVAMAVQKAGKDATAFGGAPQDAVVSRAKNFLQSKIRDDGSWGSPATTSFAAIALSGKWFPVIPATRLVEIDLTLHPKDITLGVDSTPSVGVIERGPRNVSPLAATPSLSSDTLLPTGRKALSLPERRTTDSTPRVLFPPAFFPALSAQSVFSRRETVTVVRAAIDSDGDGYPDDVEIANGYNPHDPRPMPTHSYAVRRARHNASGFGREEAKKQKSTPITNPPVGGVVTGKAETQKQKITKVKKQKLK
ncbi:MAG: hypothetical protein Q7S16_04605 [bacterium]|nr:hypothetical protein [bacterium]